jgi:tRNA(Ile)-lysidine synthetase-like protein
MDVGMLDFKFDKEANYLDAVSYGPDSMALLDMIQKAGVKPIVCFVQYHTGQDSLDDEQHLRQYCKEKGLVLEACDTSILPHDPKDDYHSWSREVRYSFFEAMYKKYDAAALFIAHQQDDLIETYLLQKESEKKITHYGLSKISTFQGMIVARPLLNYTKEDLREYDQENHIPFSDDLSDREDKFTRHPIRGAVINKLNEVERGQILDEIAKANSEKISFLQHIENDSAKEQELEIRAIMALSDDEFVGTLIRFVNNSPVRVTLSPAKIRDIRKMCLNPEPNMTYKLKDKFYLVKEYDTLTIETNPDELPYTYTLEKPGKLRTDTFDLDFSNGAEDRGIHAEDYPLTIRTAIPSDVYIYGGYLVPVRKMYKEAGMPARLLAIWPIFVNKDGKIIYVPRYKKGFSEYHSSVLNIHVKNDEK